MTSEALAELLTWWAGLDAEFRFLLLLPFAVGLAGWLADGRARRPDA